MRSMRPVALAVVVSLVFSTTVFAEVQVSMNDGRVSIVATNATPGEILTEWARVGQTKIVNLERLPRDPMTIELTNVSEREALDIVLRRVSGYVAAPREIDIPNASVFDRILVMPNSVAPMPGAAQVAARAAVQAVPAAALPGEAPSVQFSTEKPAIDQAPADTEAEQADQAAYQVSTSQVSVDPAYQSSAAYQKAKAYEAMPDVSPYSQQGALAQPEPTLPRRRSSLARSQGTQGLPGAPAPHLPAPIFQPQAVVETVNANPANDPNGDPSLRSTAGLAAVPSDKAQATFSSRHAMEVIDPREIHFKMPLQVGGSKGATPSPGGVAVPGTIVPSPKPGPK